MKAKIIALVCLCFMIVGVGSAFPSATKAAGQVINGSYGGKSYTLYVPSQYQVGQSYPLYVMLHGCTQDANQFSTGTKMNALAEEKGFLVLYPEQNIAANSNKCWNWFEPSHQSRGSGEPGVLAGMVQSIKGNYSINNDRVYVGGLSAGAAMSVIMGATYPDVFSGVAVAAGLEYKAATSMINAYTAMSSGGPNPAQQGRLAYQAMGSRAKILPIIVFHGTSDYTVNNVNGNQVISQWAVTNNLSKTEEETGWIDDQPDQSENLQIPGGKSYTVSSYKGSDNKTWMKKVFVQNMGHAWSGGSSQGSYTDPQGPDASRMIWEFFQSIEGGEENPVPESPVTAAAPKGGMYNASVQVTLTANKPANIYYTLDGTQPNENSAVYSNPISVSESATLKYFSIDANGNRESVKQEMYVIQPSSNDGTILTSIGNEDGYVGQLVADGKSNAAIKVGDKGMYNTDTYRGILSFNTNGVAGNIHSAKIRLYQKNIQGTISSLQLDIKKGFFGSSSSIEQLDYSAAATAANIASTGSLTGEYIDISLPASALANINSNGVTQFRIRAMSTAGITSNIIEFFGGETVNFEPKLIINASN
ncbi:extracellular catalytic domain type 1 short-chain-length polyhydroxyalkanoate depolymerase [Cytobacillus purgationiresistens]|uniref:Poly(Hydroxyalkanoate) depolymerase family esterase n=1 Tax=Cytobacillus purgationiresistens TaxID=863449 RepID=A0ABU0ABD4_9BACI|nr:PHB depolymerase family esterase [Cytobacillus purgationiresistens]MDQ0268568.1 poly(hydroxyalkanoate) depolymerase family esterase [Cytobacillus purgationiresistens]